jgi:hypothetical protein
MAKFRKKPVVIDAELFDGSIDSYTAIFEWMRRCGDTHALANEVYYSTPEMRIHTLEGTMSARPGDWIIRGVKGEFYPCKPDIFHATYEPVEPRLPQMDANATEHIRGQHDNDTE